MRKGLFSLNYWGPISYYAALISCDEVVFEQHERFQKQSYRSRCYIDGPNGPLMLNLAIDHNHKDAIRETLISSTKNWAQQHWQALQTSYNASPFFDALAPEIEALYDQAPSRLLDLNLATTQLVLKWLRCKVRVAFSESWQKENPELTDYREAFSAKKRAQVVQPPYPQVFDHKHGFQSDLSILDLIFNEGPAAFDYLQEL